MIAVGVGIAPMIHTLRAIFRHRDLQIKTEKNNSEDSQCNNGALKIKVKLLYGVVRSHKSC